MSRTPKHPDLICMANRSGPPSWPEREEGHFAIPFTLTIHSVGRNVEEALDNLSS